MFLASLALGSEARTVVEIGVRSGISTRCFLWAMEQTGGVLYSCDVAPAPRLSSPHWEFTQCSSRDYLPPADADLGFVDGDHSFAGCLLDMRLLWDHLRPGGWLVVHDVIPWRGHSWPGVVRAVREFGWEHWVLPYGPGFAMGRKS